MNSLSCTNPNRRRFILMPNVFKSVFPRQSKRPNQARNHNVKLGVIHVAQIIMLGLLTSAMASIDISIDKPLIQTCSNNDDDDAEADDSRFIYMLNAILSGTARLNVLLPTATILAFTIFAPLVTNDGSCSALNRWLTAFFLGLCVLSCVFFTLMDSYRTVSGRLCYGVATIHGIWSFNGGRRKPADSSAYRLRISDLFHVTLSIVAFLAFASSHNDVAACYYRAMQRKVTNVVPLVFGFVISLLLVMFPSKRRGIGYPFLLRADALHTRA